MTSAEQLAGARVAFLVALAEHGLPPWIGEALVAGEPGRYPPGALDKAMLAAIRAIFVASETSPETPAT